MTSPLDAEGCPLHNGLLWLDERVRDLLPELAQAGDPDIFHQLTGKRLSVNLTIAKVAWLREESVKYGTILCGGVRVLGQAQFWRPEGPGTTPKNSQNCRGGFTFGQFSKLKLIIVAFKTTRPQM